MSLVEGGDRLIGREEPFASEDVREALQEKGVECISACGRPPCTRRTARSWSTGGRGPLRGEQLLVATGRKLNTTDIGLETVGLDPASPSRSTTGCAPTTGSTRIGDANGRALLTHMGKYQARGRGRDSWRESSCLVSDGGQSPRDLHRPTGRGGRLHLAAAQEAGLNVRVADVPTQSAAGASFYGRDDARGTARLVVDEDRRVIVGATFTGPEVAEFLQAATVAVIGEVPLERLFHAIPAFPTRSEVWLYLLEQLGVSGPCYPLMTQQVTA